MTMVDEQNTRDAQSESFLARVRQVTADQIVYRPDYRWQVGIDAGRVFVQLQHRRTDVITGEYDWGKGGERYLSPAMTDGDILRVCLGAALSYEEHEVREFFRWRRRPGEEPRAVFGPHISVDELWSVADTLDFQS